MEDLIVLKKRIQNFLDSDSGYAVASKIVLAVLVTAGILFIAATAPNIFQAFKVFKKSRGYSDKKLKSTLYSLKRRNFIKILQEKDDKIRIELTKKGEKRIREFSIETLTISRQKHWDRKWRVIIFDIPIKFNKAREALRNKLKYLGFYQLQKSVWIFPYPCEDEIFFVAHLFQVEPFIEILTVENLLHENKIRRFFKL
ncbi:MAG: hypothetical protein AB1643_02665 [Patescibacteria group bacterium]